MCKNLIQTKCTRLPWVQRQTVILLRVNSWNCSTKWINEFPSNYLLLRFHAKEVLRIKRAVARKIGRGTLSKTLKYLKSHPPRSRKGKIVFGEVHFTKALEVKVIKTRRRTWLQMETRRQNYSDKHTEIEKNGWVGTIHSHFRNFTSMESYCS